MHHHYNDIRDRIAVSPTWFDENAAPRYSDFSPDQSADIYADEAVLMLITCQCCGHPFRVCMTSSKIDRWMAVYGRAGVGYVEKPGEREHRGEFSWRKSTPEETAAIERLSDERSLAAQIRSRTIHFGDPPNACPDDCAAGASMSSEPRRVLEYWRKGRREDGERFLDWVRDASLEIEVTPDWVNE